MSSSRHYTEEQLEHFNIQHGTTYRSVYGPFDDHEDIDTLFDDETAVCFDGIWYVVVD